ncbi:aldo/keto reductase family protein [Legionella feeleii]|uniref:D-xylose reductase III n=1 Tax=Legionella feeleii TaxID=453 RepID=A0A0W0TKQ9_9GAMM|nr:aldo/keto reductase [Legionella feeleii]KTC96179.1 D-xylose reductase III [Legionella feeleii]SPX61441.1 D-xylose reductase III [Legionella feeleii]
MSGEKGEHKQDSQIFPAFLYGTAWKEEATENLVITALKTGFTGIDTANQRKHYYEEGVGKAIQVFLAGSEKTRQDLFLQTKFTFADGQDHRKPYNEMDSYELQVQQSFRSSLEHLQTDYIDSYILHGPLLSDSLSTGDWEVWHAMEALWRAKKIKFLGISNVTLKQLEEFYTYSTVKPTFVQNRCFAVKQWDKGIRAFCREHGLIYQGFSLLTANYQYFSQPWLRSIAQKYQKNMAQLIFRFALQMKMLPLTGTTDQQHMREDLAIGDFTLSVDELEQIENVALL